MRLIGLECIVTNADVNVFFKTNVHQLCQTVWKIPLSGRSFLKTMITWLHFSSSSANSNKRTKLNKQQKIYRNNVQIYDLYSICGLNIYQISYHNHRKVQPQNCRMSLVLCHYITKILATVHITDSFSSNKTKRCSNTEKCSYLSFEPSGRMNFGTSTSSLRPMKTVSQTKVTSSHTLTFTDRCQPSSPASQNFPPDLSSFLWHLSWSINLTGGTVMSPTPLPSVS